MRVEAYACSPVRTHLERGTPQLSGIAGQLSPSRPPAADFSEAPDQQRHRKPNYCCDGKNQRRRSRGQKPPHDCGEYHQCESSQRGSSRIEAGSLSTADCAVESDLLLFCFLVLFDQRDAGRKDGWECQEEASDARAEFLGDQACPDSDCTAKEDSHGILVPPGLAERGRIDSHSHHESVGRAFYLSQTNHSENATPNQMIRHDAATKVVDSL
jgi:hypothetical protein